MSRSNKRRAARSDSRANFAARAGETALSPSNNSTTRPAPLARNLDWTAQKLFGTTRQLSGQNVSLLGGRRVSAGLPASTQSGVGRTWTLAAWAATATTDGRSPSRAAEPAHPVESSRQREVGEPQREDRRRGLLPAPTSAPVGGASASSFIAAALAPAAAASGCSASATISRKGSANPSKLVASDNRTNRRRFAGLEHRAARSRRKPRHSRWTRPAGLVAAFPPALDGRCSASRSAEESSRWRASAAQAAAARNARRWRSAPANGGSARRIWSAERARRRRGKPPRSPRRRRQRLFRRPRPDGNACSNSGLVGAERGAASRRDAAAARRRRRAARIGGGSFVVEDVGGRESNHGLSITQGGALSSSDPPNPPRLSCENNVR